MIKVYLDGAKHISGQVNRIGEGFVELGCELTEFVGEADLIYSNNPSQTRTQIVRDKADGKLKPGAKLIFTVLDVPIHLWGVESFQKEIPQIIADLNEADAVCSISEYTRGMVKEKYGFDSTVIYNPIQPIYRSPYISRGTFGCSIGRRYDSNKGTSLWLNALQILGVPENQILIVGSESIPWGNYQGVLTDERLNEVYNSCHFSFSCSFVEGLNLPVIESMAAGCIPVILTRMTTREELLPSNRFPEYLDIEPDPVSIAKFIARFSQDNGAREDLTNRLISHYNNNLKEKFSGRSVAQKILNLYNTL